MPKRDSYTTRSGFNPEFSRRSIRAALNFDKASTLTKGVFPKNSPEALQEIAKKDFEDNESVRQGLTNRNPDGTRRVLSGIWKT